MDDGPLRLIVLGAAGSGVQTLVDTLLGDCTPEPGASSHGAPEGRCIATAARRFTVVAATDADRPGTRALVLGAATADCALIVVDASEADLSQARRHTHLVQLLGVAHVAVVFTKMDLAGYSLARFAELEGNFRQSATGAGLEQVTCLPASALEGDNIRARSDELPGYAGPTVVDYLESVAVEREPPSDPGPSPEVASQIEATVVWLGEKPMLRGRSYFVQRGAGTLTGRVTPLKYKLDLDSLEHLAATKLERNEVGVCEIELSQAIAFDPAPRNRQAGGFRMIDDITGATLGVGLINCKLRRDRDVRWQALTIDKHERSLSLCQQPAVVWMTGLSGAGKSTIANLVEGELHDRGHHTYLLDGDNVRHGLNSDLGFSQADRVENIRRVAELAHLMVDAGLIVLVSFISPFRAERRMARLLFDPAEFVEVFVDAPLAVAEERDPKGLYRRARRGELRDFTGIDSPYEPPDAPEITVRTAECTAPEGAQQVIDGLEQRGRLRPPTAEDPCSG